MDDFFLERKGRLRIVLLAALLLPVAALAQGVPAPDAAELERLLLEFLDGASRNDPAAHERFWADELIYTRSAGVRTDKAEILEGLRAAPDPDEPPTAYSAEDVRVRQYGDTAVVAFRLVGRVGGDTPETLQFLNTGTFLKRDGEWRAVAWQATRVPDVAADAPVNLTPGPAARPALADEIRRADAEFFRAVFDTCDIDTLRRLVADDFEMIHDKGGVVARSGAEFVESAREKCRRQAQGSDFRSARRLVPQSLAVFPVQDDSAIATGVHRFYALKAGEPDRLTETGRFTVFWTHSDGRWRMARALSYGHVLAQ